MIFIELCFMGIEKIPSVSLVPSKEQNDIEAIFMISMELEITEVSPLPDGRIHE